MFLEVMSPRAFLEALVTRLPSTGLGISEMLEMLEKARVEAILV